MSKRLQEHKANVVSVASSAAGGSGEHRDVVPPRESEPLRIMPRYATLAGPPTLSVVEGVAVCSENAVPRRRCLGMNGGMEASARALRVTEPPVRAAANAAARIDLMAAKRAGGTDLTRSLAAGAQIALLRVLTTEATSGASR